MSETRIIFDTSALIEFFDLTKKGEKVKEILQTDGTVLVPSIVVAELVSKLKRRKFDPTEFVGKLESSTEILPLDWRIAKHAGELHAELRKTDDTISLADCIIMAHTEFEDARVLTYDGHFDGFKKRIKV
jgi:predicted nucleic acid-binding protein